MDSSRELLIYGIILGSILSFFGNMVVSLYFRRCDGKSSNPDNSMYVISVIGLIGINLILVAGILFN